MSITSHTNVFVPSWYLQTPGVLIVTMSSLSSILVNRLVLNLRERAVEQLPATVETIGRFQAALPVFRQPLSMISVRNTSFVMTATRETVAGFPEGDTLGQQLRTMDTIGYEMERRSQATSASVRRHFSVRQNRNRQIGETVSVGTTTKSHRSANDATTLAGTVGSAAGSFGHGKEITAPT